MVHNIIECIDQAMPFFVVTIYIKQGGATMIGQHETLIAILNKQMVTKLCEGQHNLLDIEYIPSTSRKWIANSSITFDLYPC